MRMPQGQKQVRTSEFRFQADSLDTIARNPSSGKKEAEKKSGSISKAMFYRGADTLAAFDQKGYHSHVDRFQVEKQVILSDADYQEFTQNITKPYPFLSSNRKYMYFEPDAQCWHCLFVTGEHAAGGILVDSEGYPHAEYSARVLDKARLNLSEIPVESYHSGQPGIEAQRTREQEEKRTAKENGMGEKGRKER